MALDADGKVRIWAPDSALISRDPHRDEDATVTLTMWLRDDLAHTITDAQIGHDGQSLTVTLEPNQ